MTVVSETKTRRIKKGRSTRRLRRLHIDLELRAHAELINQFAAVLVTFLDRPERMVGCFFTVEIELMVQRIEAALSRINILFTELDELGAEITGEDEFRKNYTGTMLAAPEDADDWPEVVRRVVIGGWRPYRYDSDDYHLVAGPEE